MKIFFESVESVAREQVLFGACTMPRSMLSSFYSWRLEVFRFSLPKCYRKAEILLGASSIAIRDLGWLLMQCLDHRQRFLALYLTENELRRS